MEQMSDPVLSALNAQPVNEEMILVVGVGGAGCNAVSNMWRRNIRGVSYLACNTDQKSLNQSPVPSKIRLGADGLGAGNNPERGRSAAIESLEEVRFRLASSGCRMVFIAAGMGGGTGTGAAPVIAKLAREMELLTVGIVSSPLADEGEKRWKQALEAIAEMEQHVDALLVIDNDNVVNTFKDLSLAEAFSRADDVLATAARGIAEIITRESDLVNIDFADVSAVMRNCGRAHMSVTSARGENRVEEVIRASLCSPLLGQAQIAGAKNVLVNFSTHDSDDLKAGELTRALQRIQKHANAGRESVGLSPSNIIWGTNKNEEMEPGVLELVIIATGFEAAPLRPASILSRVSSPDPAQPGESAGEAPSGRNGGSPAGSGGAADSAAVHADGAKASGVAERVSALLSRRRAAGKRAAAAESPAAPGNDSGESDSTDDADSLSGMGIWKKLSGSISLIMDSVFKEGEDTPLQ